MSFLRPSRTAFLLLAAVFLAGTAPKAQAEDPKGFTGPSVHLFVGIRNKKAPNLDEYDTVLGGVKFSVANYFMSDYSYLSLLGAGIGFQRNLRFIVGLSPVMINHTSGIGISFDLYPTSDRGDRPGGPFGLSLNFDVIRLAAYLGSM